LKDWHPKITCLIDLENPEIQNTNP